ncbi:MAG: glycosyltransferase family 4 protein [Raineya sp.]|jgi:glycosyltransferase involved in cell wall biosynthesis|nr:glycosyltransferase family 4 protein [Raineya sp.]
MKILQIHNQYLHKGGEDSTVANEKDLLISYGEHVEQLFFDNSKISGFEKVKMLYKSIYNRNSSILLREKISSFKPDVIHTHNFFYVASPSIFYEAKRQQIPVVSTLHNFRLICSGSLLLRDGKTCELCTKAKFPIAGIKHKCFQDSTLKTAQLTFTTGIHKVLGTWKNKIDKFITFTEFTKQKLLKSSLQLPSEKLVIKPNFVSDMGFEPSGSRKNYFLYVGRLSQEKGIEVVLKATNHHKFPLEIIGSGDLEPMVKEYVSSNPHITYHGFQNKDFILEKMKAAKALIIPSVCYEGMPLALLECFSTGTPVIISDIDNLNEMVTNHQNGLHFKTGDAEDLAIKIAYFEKNDFKHFYENARNTYLTKYTPEINYKILMEIYQSVIKKQ